MDAVKEKPIFQELDELYAATVEAYNRAFSLGIDSRMIEAEVEWDRLRAQFAAEGIELSEVIYRRGIAGIATFA